MNTDKQKYIEHQLKLNAHIKQAELERKWRVYEEEQEQMQLAFRMTQNVSGMSGTSILLELLYMDLGYMDDELNYVE